MAVILRETLSGAPPEVVSEISGDIVYKIFGDELSMGKSMGLMGMVAMVRNFARKHIAETTERGGPQ
jgi:cysteine desulfuration protein SufE